jgi:cyclohexanone monooxygenase
MGANIPGKPRVFMPNLDFVGPYRAKCDQIAANGWEGFAVDGEATPAGVHVYTWAVAG